MKAKQQQWKVKFIDHVRSPTGLGGRMRTEIVPREDTVKAAFVTVNDSCLRFVNDGGETVKCYNARSWITFEPKRT